MENREALTIFRTIQKCRHQALHTNDCGNCERCQYRLEQEQIDGAVALAISALEKQEAIKSCTPPSDDWEHYADRLHDIAYQSGYEQGKKDAEQDRWIPVTERLPEDYTDVLVWFEYFRYGNYNRLYQSHGIGNYSKRYDSWTVNHETGWRDLRVFAWRPLPEPYTEEES